VGYPSVGQVCWNTLKEGIMVFHHKLSARDHVQGIMNLKPFLNLFHIILRGRKNRRLVKNAYPEKASYSDQKLNYGRVRRSGEISGGNDFGI
jgi:hypothetical protein